MWLEDEPSVVKAEVQNGRQLKQNLLPVPKHPAQEKFLVWLPGKKRTGHVQSM